MKRFNLFTWLLVCSAFGSIALWRISQPPISSANTEYLSEWEEEEGDAERKRSMLKARFEQEFKMTMDPATGTVPRERLIDAYKYMIMQGGKTNAAIAGVDWIERGPDNVAGRSRTMLVDPNDVTGNTIWVGSVSGGLWKTTDITANPPVWTPADEFFNNLAVTTIAADPSNPLVMYFGTGEGYFNLDAVQGNGIWKTTNGGTSWTQLASTNNANFNYVQKIAVTSTGVVLAATSTGLRRSADGGATFTKVLGTGLGITGATSNFCYDVEVAADGDIYSSLDGSIHRSTNAGVTFGAAQTLPITASRVELACAPNDAAYVYAVVELGTTVNGILRTTNDGTTWTSRTEPVDADPGCPAADFSNGQAWYNLTVAVDPNNRDVLMVGGLDLFRSTDGAGTWQQIAHWYGGFSEQYVHADQHYILYQPGSSSIAYFCNDGGIYRTTNANVAGPTDPTITFKGDNFNVTQFYSCALHPTAFSNYALAGSQDNGSHQFSAAGINSTVEVTGGDGGFCHIDQDQPQFQFTAYIFNDFYRSTNGGSSWTNISSSGGLFINPSDYDNVNNRMYSARGANQYLRWDDPQTGATFTTVAATFGGGTVSCVTVSPNTANRVFFGLDNGDVVRVDNAHAAATFTNVSTGLPAAYMTCIEVENGNDNHLLVTYSNYGVNSVWESLNGGTTWTSVEGNLPDMPVRWALFNPNNTDQALLATELGVWSTDNLNAGATVWGASNTGLANVRTDMLQIRTSDKIVIAGTHGRGLYSTDVFANPTALFSADKTLSYISKNIQFTDESYNATSWLWDFGDGFTSTAQNPVHAYTTAGKFNVTLTINGGADSEVKNNYIHILPDRGTPYVVASDGSTFEINVDDFGSQSVLGGVNLWERGVPSNFLVTVNSPVNVWKTDLDADIVSGTYQCVLQTPSYNFSSSASAYTLRFRRSMEIAFCNGPFAVQVQYSTDKGDTWTRLGVNADPASTNWYNRGPATGCPVDASIFPDRYGWTITSNNTLCTYNITTGVPALVGQPSVCFRFIMSVVSGFSAGGYAVDGFMVDDFEILGPSNPAGLPVEGSPLTGYWSGNNTSLTWRTFQEVNNKGFQIQRSLDGRNFSDIGWVDGVGNSNKDQAYSFTDLSPVGDRIWYRYQQVDMDGATALSNVVELTRPDDGAFTMSKVYPNPFTDVLNIEFGDRYPEGGLLEVMDVRGAVLHRETLSATGGTSLRITQPWQNAAPGIYLVRVTYEGTVRSSKVIKL
jgi:PKD repeat protein